MTLEKDTFRIELRYAKLCMELDCNTIFDAGMYRHCPTCGSSEVYPLEAWLNRSRIQKPEPALHEELAGALAVVASVSRPLRHERRQVARLESESQPGELATRALARVALRRRAG
ncbi:MAG TPA: hypothetical protein VFO08_22245 [Methylomirabilota bacterium]|jgi:hypothetical protein|nr:hypothetical protein [Methylomirabilota bacterium]